MESAEKSAAKANSQLLGTEDRSWWTDSHGVAGRPDWDCYSRVRNVTIPVPWMVWVYLIGPAVAAGFIRPCGARSIAGSDSLKRLEIADRFGFETCDRRRFF